MGTHRGRRGVVGLIALSIAATTVVEIGSPPSEASTNTAAYELYCSTAQGHVVVNGVVTTGTMAPAKPKSGQKVSLTNYQTTLRIPDVLMSSWVASGNKVVSGTATSAVDVSGATPKSISSAKPRSTDRRPWQSVQ
jgi:hypothetical protein